MVMELAINRIPRPKLQKTTLLLIVVAFLLLNNVRLLKAHRGEVPQLIADANTTQFYEETVGSLIREKSAMAREIRFLNYLYRSVDMKSAPQTYVSTILR